MHRLRAAAYKLSALWRCSYKIEETEYILIHFFMTLLTLCLFRIIALLLFVHGFSYVPCHQNIRSGINIL